MIVAEPQQQAFESGLQSKRLGLSYVWRSIRRPLLLAGIIVFVLWFTGYMERYFYYPTAGPTPLPSEFPGAESVWFASADGTRLHGWFIPAPTRETASGRAPSILHMHGNAGNIESHIWFTEYLPAAGFNLFIFDYRGYGQSEGKATRRGPLIADTSAALDALLERGDVDPNHIGMYSQSLGGAIGLNVMARRPEIRCAVIESAFASWREMAACAIGGAQPNFFCRSIAAALISDDHRPDEAIAKIQRPILLLHGDADSMIPVRHSRQLARAANGFAQLVEFPGGDHNTLRETHPEIDQLVIEFFLAHLHD